MDFLQLFARIWLGLRSWPQFIMSLMYTAVCLALVEIPLTLDQLDNYAVLVDLISYGRIRENAEYLWKTSRRKHETNLYALKMQRGNLRASPCCVFLRFHVHPRARLTLLVSCSHAEVRLCSTNMLRPWALGKTL